MSSEVDNLPHVFLYVLSLEHVGSLSTHGGIIIVIFKSQWGQNPRGVHTLWHSHNI